VESCGNCFEAGEPGKTPQARACSACTGDYEDPDRTAWTLEDEEKQEREDEESIEE
jgi:hypothetical protein